VRTWADGVNAFRQMEQGRTAPDIARLSDQDESRMTMAMAGSGGRVQRLAKRWLKLRGHGDGCLVILGFEGDSDDLGERMARVRGLMSDAGGVRLGTRAGEAWRRGRYRGGPYFRDELIARGIMAETLETATSWSNLDRLYNGVRNALRESLDARGTPPLVMCHVSHLYPSGASLYFTFIAKQEKGAELEQWHAAKSAACDAIVANGGTITHHHAIGKDHVPWMRAEVGDSGVELLRAAKERLDPSGVMNPGKLIPSPKD
jgi:alkyldihydroxyacetonephosphate synthase